MDVCQVWLRERGVDNFKEKGEVIRGNMSLKYVRKSFTLKLN